MFGILIGVVIGYMFKPQIEKGLVKALRFIRDKESRSKNKDRYEDY